MTNFNSVEPVTAGKHNNANGSPLVVTVLNNGTITVRFYSKITTSINTTKQWKLTQSIQKVKSFLLARYRQNSDKDTETVTKNLYRISKSFTKLIKVSSQVSTEKALYTWKPCCRLFRHIRIEFTNDIKKRLIVFRHVRREFSVSIKKGSSLAELANYLPFWLIFSRQVAITQAEKLVEA